MFAVSQFARLAPLRSSTSNERPERRGARAMRVVVHANSESDDTPRVTRRVLGVGSAALSAAFAKGLSFPTPAEAKEIVSGYKPLDGYDVTYVTHRTGDVGVDEWYNTVFKPFQDGGLHSGEVGGPDSGPAFAKVFDVVVMRGREPVNETVSVAMIHPKESSEGLARFFDDSNPFWEEGREAGWLEGPITHYKASPFLVRNPDPKTGLPRDLKKGEGIMLAAFGSKISKNDWVQSFTSSDSDVLHDAHGVVSSTASNLNRGSDFDSRYKSLVATHHFKKFNQAKAFHDKFTSGAEPPFDQIHEILDNFESVPLEVIKETYYPEIGREYDVFQA